MRNFVMGCAVGALVALSARSEALPPVIRQVRTPVLQKSVFQVGISSWYGEECQGNPTASG